MRSIALALLVVVPALQAQQPTQTPPQQPQPPGQPQLQPQPTHTPAPPPPVRIGFFFQGAASPQTTDPAEAQSIIAARTAMRAWGDSVDVYLDQIVLAAQDKGWMRARANESANYYVMVTGVPVHAAGCTAAGLTAYAVAVLQPGSGNQWRYLNSFVSYGTGAQQAAGVIFSTSAQAINTARTTGAGH